MKIYSEISIADFEAWSGGKNTLDRVIAEDKCDELEAVLEELYPDGMTDTQLNDILWFEPETVFEWLGIRTESEIREELEEAREELEELKQNYADECEEMIDFNNSEREAEELDEMDEEEIESIKAEIWANNYVNDAAELEEKISELEEELENI